LLQNGIASCSIANLQPAEVTFFEHRLDAES
jgi:hypothetical protein